MRFNGRHLRREERLLAEIDLERLPRHIAVIMDGNGRWARARGLPRIAGHRAGVRPVREITRACGELGIQVLTLYAFSTENWIRPKSEIRLLMSLLAAHLKSEVPELMRNNVQLSAIGRLRMLPPAVRRALEQARRALASNTGLRLVLALSYGGRQEIVDAVERLLRDRPGRLDERSFGRYLYTAGLPDPDLIIRTSGEMRLSNFLLWQAAYAEIWVTDKFWPDFTRADLYEAIADYQKRGRRFGGIVSVA